MILVILAISIAMIIGGFIWADKAYNDTPGFMVGFIGVVTGFCALIATIILCIIVSGHSVIDEKIDMYQTENSQIEQRVAECVERYQEYESGIFADVAPEDSMTMIALYPDLKSDELVKQQISVYISNNEKIKELKAEQLYSRVERWWLYFG